MEFLIAWTAPGQGVDRGAARSVQAIDELLRDWEACVHRRGVEELDLRWASANEEEWARRTFGWPAPFALREQFGWGEADQLTAKLLVACPSAAISTARTPGSAQGAIGLQAIRVDDDSLALSRELRPPEVPFGLWFPDNLGRIEEIDAAAVVLTSVEEFDPEPLYRLPSRVTSLALYGTPVRPGSLRLDRLQVTELAVGWTSVDPTSPLSPTIRSLQIVDSGPESVTDVPGSATLEELDLGAGQRITSLEGIDRFPGLATLSISNGHRLQDLAGIETLPLLKTLTFDGCTRVRDFAQAGACTQLTDLWLTDCGDVATVTFLRNLPDLTRLGANGTTKILDGDLQPVLELGHLRDLAIARRRHYRPRVAEVYERLSISPDTLSRIDPD